MHTTVLVTTFKVTSTGKWSVWGLIIHSLSSLNALLGSWWRYRKENRHDLHSIGSSQDQPVTYILKRNTYLKYAAYTIKS